MRTRPTAKRPAVPVTTGPSDASSRRSNSDPQATHPRLRWSIAAAALAAVSGLTYARLYFGVDLTDESFYTAVPYRFVLGARPLVDETNVAQLTPGLLLYPFVKIYDAAVGNGGIVLYTRHLHFLLSVGIAVALYAALRRVLRDGPSSALLAAAAVAFVPFGIHGPSYNVFASLFFAAGCFLGVAAATAGTTRLFALAGAAQGIAVFTYPPFAVPVACFFAALFVAARPATGRRVAAALLPTAVAALAALGFFVQDGVGTARELFARASTYSGQGGGFAKAVDVSHAVISDFPHPLLAVLLVAGALALRRLKPLLACIPLLALPLVALPEDIRSAVSSNAYVTNLGLLAPGLFLLVRRDGVARLLVGVVWLPAVVGGEVTALTSNNGSINFAIGFFPAAVVATALASTAIRDGLRASPPVLGAIGDLLPALAALAVGVTVQYTFVYRDAHLTLLTARVAHGPYAGLRTTPAKRNFLLQLDRDLAAVSGPRCRILFYDAFPAGYLLGHGRPETNTALLLDITGDKEASYERILLDYYASRGALPDVAVRMDRIPLGATPAIQTYTDSDPLERLFRSRRYTTVLTRPDYRISRRSGTRCRTGESG